LSSISALLRLVPQALLFDGDAYYRMKARPRALYDGTLLLLALGVGLGLAGAAGAVVAAGAAPRGDELARVLRAGLARLPALQRLSPWPTTWLHCALLGWLAAPQPGLARLLTTPLALALNWLAYGLLAQRAARLLGGCGSLAETLACTALAEVPRVVLLMPLVSPLGLAAAGIEAWVLAARFQALRAAHGLDGWRAFWAAAAAALLLGAASLALAALQLASRGVG